jgi:G3E family GTPase
MPMPAKPRLPILVLTGFLGSGKTTLLNRLLRDGPRTAVLINEFGETPVDQELLERRDLPVMTLAGGCLCCQIKGALAPFLKNLWMAWGKPGAPRFDRIILETSGVATPEPVLDTLLRDRWLAERYALQGVVATLAVPAAADHIDRFPEAQAQAVWADALVLTQSDLAGTGDLAALEARLDALAPATPRLYAVRGELDPADLLAQIGSGYRRAPDGSEAPDHGFRSFSIHWEAPVSWDGLRPALAGLLARHSALVRVKGVLHRPDGLKPIAVQGAAGRLYPPAELPAGQDTRGRLVFIVAGPPDGLAMEAMAALSEGTVRGMARLH